MSTIEAWLTEAIDWLLHQGLVLAIGLVVLVVVYRWARPAIHRVMSGVMTAQLAAFGTDVVGADEVRRRFDTIEDLLFQLLKITVVVLFFVVVLAVFDLWGLVAGLGLIAAAITLAGQSIVLDYLMGILILVEGQFYKGDTIRVDGIEGVVVEMGLRRTVVRDVTGTTHSISNGLIRTASAQARDAVNAVVDVDGIADPDVDRALAVLDAVGAALAADPALSAAVIEPLKPASTLRLTSAGATLRLAAVVKPARRVEVETELRRRVATALAEAGIEPIRATPTAPPTA